MMKRLILVMLAIFSITFSSAIQVDDLYSINALERPTNLSAVLSFLELTDTPANYLGEANNCVKVNGLENGLLFGDCANTTADITGVFGDEYITNGSASGEVNLVFNESRSNATGDLRWIQLSEEGNLNVNSSDFWDDLDDFNTTQMSNSGGTLNILESFLTTFINTFGFGDFSFSDFQASFDTNFSGKDTDDLSQGSTNFYDNRSWNESLANTLFTNFTTADEQDPKAYNGTLRNVDNGTFTVDLNATAGADIFRTDGPTLMRIVTAQVSAFNLPITSIECDTSFLGRNCLLENLILIDARQDAGGTLQFSDKLLSAIWSVQFKNDTKDFEISDNAGNIFRIKSTTEINSTLLVEGKLTVDDDMNLTGEADVGTLKVGDSLIQFPSPVDLDLLISDGTDWNAFPIGAQDTQLTACPTSTLSQIAWIDRAGGGVCPF